ncbi:MAG: hypothetical protein GX868_05570 [Actinobacteria bacterium]|nr:hypothetical protein [Actinomycetota bacterium]
MLVDIAERTFVLNLETRADRRAETIAELTGRFGAAAVEELVEFVPAVRPSDAGEFPSIGARGAFESHLKALRLARDRGLSSVLILEDDVEFNVPSAVLDAAVALLRDTPDWQYASLGYLPDHFSIDVNDFARRALHTEFGEEVAPPTDGGTMLAATDDGSVRLVSMRGGHIGAHCLVFRASIFDAIIAHLKACLASPAGTDVVAPMNPDGAYNTFSWIDPAVRAVVVPSLATQRSSRSDVSPHWLDQAPLVGSALDGFRRLKRARR